MDTIEEIRRHRLRSLVEEFGSVVALAQAFGRSPAQISQWLNASIDFKSGKPRNISSNSARELEARLGKPRLWMDMPLDAPADTVRIPQLKNVASMGTGKELSEEVMAGDLSLTTTFVRDELRLTRLDGLRFLHTYGDSMEPTLRSGDVVLVDTSATAVTVDGIYVLRAHDRLFIKRVRQRIDGKFEISSDNPTHKTVDVLDGGHEVSVVGRVVWFWNGHRVM